MRIFVLAIFSCLAVQMTAQHLRPDSVLQFNSKQLDSAANPQRTPDKPGRLLARSKDKESYLIVVRTKAGDVEMHEQFDDVTLIRSGKGILRTGFDLSDSKQSGTRPAREWLGGSIADKRDRVIQAGDFLVIPAGLAHQYIPAPGDTLTYFVVKVRNAQKK